MTTNIEAIPATGILHDLDERTYHSHPALSQSRAKVLLEPGGPARFRWAEDHPQPRRDVFEFGKAAHSKVLGVGVEVVVSQYADYRTKEAREWKAAQQDAGIVVLSQDDYRAVDEMALQLSRHKLAMSLLENTEREVSLFAVDPATGIPMRGRLDAGSGVGFVDYKTAKTADPERFASSIAMFGYHVQRAWYSTLGELTGSGFGDRFRFIVQEKTAPYLVSVCEIDALSDLRGREQMRTALDIYAECVATDTWPGYPEEIHLLTLPAWAFDDLDFDSIGD